jgi:peptide deformylase
MALLEILQYPDPRLRIKAKVVSDINTHIKAIVADMYETMYAANGVGLAATQAGINWRIFVMDVSETRKQPLCAINPEILTCQGEQFESEGCLSVSEAFDKIKRAQSLRFRALDINGQIYEMAAENLMASCVQHEIDHLNGKLFIDHLSRLKQDRIRKKLEKIQRRKE